MGVPYPGIQPTYSLKDLTIFIFRIAAQEALDNRGLVVLANLIENHTDAEILEHTLRALAEITYPFPGKVRNYYHQWPIQSTFRLQQIIMKPYRQNWLQ